MPFWERENTQFTEGENHSNFSQERKMPRFPSALCKNIQFILEKKIWKCSFWKKEIWPVFEKKGKYIMVIFLKKGKYQVFWNRFSQNFSRRERKLAKKIISRKKKTKKNSFWNWENVALLFLQKKKTHKIRIGKNQNVLFFLLRSEKSRDAHFPDKRYSKCAFYRREEEINGVLKDVTRCVWTLKSWALIYVRVKRDVLSPLRLLSSFLQRTGCQKLQLVKGKRVWEW